MSRQVKDRAEYDEAVAIIQWLRARAREMVDAGDVTSAQRMAVATLTIADVFLLPPAGTVPHVHAYVNAEDYTGNAFCECGEQEGAGR